MADKLLKPFLNILLVCLALFFVARVVIEKRDLIAIDGDGKGYYAYLPTIIFGHSLDWEKLNESKPGYTNDFVNEIDGKKINKYSPGVAIFILPFFLLTVIAIFISGHYAVGPTWFSAGFQYGVLLAGMFHLFIGLIFLKKFLQTYSINEKNILITILSFLFGTNLLYYSLYEPSMSHVYAFCCINAFVYYSRKFFLCAQSRHFYLAILLYGLAILIRPTHVFLILLIPFLREGKNSTSTLFNKKNILVGTVIFLLIISIQIILWYAQTGHFFVMSYTNEGFYFLYPEFFNVLFSFRKGLFIYTPLLLIAVLGLIPLFKQYKRKTIFLISFITLITYILCSWWNWYYGDSFGQRAFIDYYILFAIAFAFLLEKSKPIIKKIILSSSVIFIFLNLIQTYQYKTGIIHPDAMNFEKYKTVFLRTGSDYKYSLTGAPELFYISNGKSITKTYHPYMMNSDSTKTASLTIDKNEYGMLLETEINETSLSGKRAYISVNISNDKPFVEPDHETRLVVSLTHSNGDVYFRKSEKLFSIEKQDKVQQQEFGFRLPTIHSKDDKLSVYVWNKDKKEFSIYDTKIELWEAND